MSKAFIDDTNLTNIANSIRSKLGVSDTYLPSEMAGAIQNIPKRKVIDFNITPKTLDNAEQNSLQYVKAYGGTEQNGTPTPTSPVNIVCNNGVIKARHESGLPLGYTLLDKITADSSSGGNVNYVNTGIKASSSIKVEIVCDRPAPPASGTVWFLCASQPDNSGQYSIFESTNSTPNQYLAVTYGATGSSEVKVIGNTSKTESTFTFNGGILKYDNNTGTVTSPQAGQTFSTNNDIWLFGRDQVVINTVPCTIYSAKFWDNNVLVRDLVCVKRNSDNVLGMYDFVENEFIAGTGSFTAGNTVSDPTIIYTEGDTETIRISSENLVDFTSLTIVPNTAISETGELVSNSGVNFCESYISVLPNQTYKISGDILGGNIGQQTYYFRSASYDVDKIFISRSDAVTGTEYTFTTDSTTKYIRFHYINTATLNTYKLQLDNTATCERLLSLNGYTDTQEILSGIVNRKIGIKVLDGTEDWSTQTGTHPYVYHNFYDGIITDLNYVLNEKITHFECVPITVTTNNQGAIVATRVNRYTAVFLRYDNLFDPTTTSGRNTLKTFLQTQYNNGTPVIIIYPLATPTTESVTGQSLQVEAGDNILEITQSSLSNLEVECEYFIQ